MVGVRRVADWAEWDRKRKSGRALGIGFSDTWKSYIASVAEFTPRNVQSTKDRVKLVYEVRVRITGDAKVDLKPGLPADVRFDRSVSSR